MDQMSLLLRLISRTYFSYYVLKGAGLFHGRTSLFPTSCHLL